MTGGLVIDRLPAHYRAADSEGILSAYLELLGSQLAEIFTLVDRFSWVDEHGQTQSDLVDPGRADNAWLRWLAQLAGIDTSLLTAPSQIRGRLRAGFLDVGSLGALNRQLAEYLEPGSYTIIQHYEGNPWVAAIVTDVADLGLTTWQTFETDHPTWGSTIGLTWDDLAPSNDILGRAEIQALRPAGVTFVLELIGEPGTWLVLSQHAPTWDDIEELDDWDALEALELEE